MSTISSALSKRQQTAQTAAAPAGPQPAAAGPAGAPVFSINFLRHQTVPVDVQRMLVVLAIGYLVANAALALVLLATAGYTSAQAMRVQARVSVHTAPPHAKASGANLPTLYEEGRKDLAQLQTMVGWQRQRFPLTGKLAALAKTLPARTWVTGLSGSRDDRTLTIRAAYVVDPDAPYELPAKAWMEALKADPLFGAGLKRLDLVSSFRKTQGTATVVLFDMEAQWAPPS
jgi:Tfp pilus assembly protein PilN